MCHLPVERACRESDAHPAVVRLPVCGRCGAGRQRSAGRRHQCRGVVAACAPAGVGRIRRA
ncbi:hypothetical protein BRM50_12095, partial [Xanthomonas oryzae pv. oryzae]